MTDPEFWRRPAWPFTPEVLAAAGEHAVREAPREACGLVRAGRYVPCRNVHPQPERAFTIEPAPLLEALVACDLEGVVHSHPEQQREPSREDMRAQDDMGVPWAILVPGPDAADLACVMGGPRPPVFRGGSHVQRAFCHGVADCYELVRDWFAEARGVGLPHVPRNWLWWEDGENLYLDLLAGAGFEVLSEDRSQYAAIARPGDVFLRRVDSRVPNHAGVYLGQGLCLEQMPRSLSQCRPVGAALHTFTHWLRHRSLAEVVT